MKVASEAPARATSPPDGAGPAEDTSPARWVVAAAVLVIVAGIVLRFATRSDLWLDEALSVNISRLPYGDIPEWLRHDGAPPLYYFMLHAWTDVFGTTDFAVRSLSGVLSVATFVPMWFAGRRIAGRAGAWIAVVILAASPFAIGFGSETRMYSLVMLLVTVGYLAVRRLLERPSLGRQAVVALITGLLLYTHYWSFYLIAVVAALLIWQAWRGSDADRRHAARAALVALVAGAITFLPWIPTFLYQSQHTGTPWGDPIFMTASFAFALRDFAGGEHSEAYALLVVLIMLTIVALFGRANDRYRIELDVRTRPGVRAETLTWVATLLLGGAFAFVTRGTFAGRYASILYPLFVLVIAYGITVFADKRVRAVLLADRGDHRPREQFPHRIRQPHSGCGGRESDPSRRQARGRRPVLPRPDRAQREPPARRQARPRTAHVPGGGQAGARRLGGLRAAAPPRQDRRLHAARPGPGRSRQHDLVRRRRAVPRRQRGPL